MRASELCGLRLRDLDPGGGILYARGKGDKERAIPYMGAPRRAVEEYIAEYRPQLDKNRAEWLFLSRNGKQLHRETLWGDPAQTRRGRRSAGRSGSIRTSCATPSLPSSYATAWTRGRFRNFSGTAR